MASLRTALARIGVDAAGGLRAALQAHPPGLHELIRVATLPGVNLADVEPDDPHTFESFELEDPQGIAHGGGSLWFLSSQFTVRRCRIEGSDPFRPANVAHGARRHLDELLAESGLPAKYDHLGDLGFKNHILYAPVRCSDGPPHLLLGLSETLQVVGWTDLSTATGESACAVNPWTGLLHLPAADNSGRLHAYDITAFEERLGTPSAWGRRLSAVRRADADIELRTPAGISDRGGLQGVAFSPNGRIYVTRSLGEGPWNNLLYVYSALTGRRFGTGREWDFNGSGDEIEGIAVHPSGVLYIVVADNDPEWLDTDDFDLYALRFRNHPASEV